MHRAQKEQRYGDMGVKPDSQPGSSEVPLSAVLQAIEESRAALGAGGQGGPQRGGGGPPQQGEKMMMKPVAVIQADMKADNPL